MVAQWLKRCAAEPKNAGSLPGRGGCCSVLEISARVRDPLVVHINPEPSTTLVQCQRVKSHNQSVLSFFCLCDVFIAVLF